MSEHSEQAMVIEWAMRHEGLYPELRWLHSSLNGIFIPGPKQVVYRIMNHMKAEGMKRGVPDLFLPVARRGYHGLYIEMKRDDGGVLSDEQKEFLAFAEAQGYRDQVCYGYDDAVKELEWYLEKVV
jgi:hypothetical protein